MWAPFVGRMKAAGAGVMRPAISTVSGGAFHRGNDGVIAISGSPLYRRRNPLKRHPQNEFGFTASERSAIANAL